MVLDKVYMSFINGGYKGSKSDFISLLKKNQEALDDAYKLYLNLGFKKEKKEFYNSIIREFNLEKVSISNDLKKLEILYKSEKTATKNLLKYKNNYLNVSEIKNNMLYCFIILFGILYPVRLIYKLLKWSFLTIKKKD